MGVVAPAEKKKRAEPVAESDRKEFAVYYVLAFEVKWLPYALRALI